MKCPECSKKVVYYEPNVYLCDHCGEFWWEATLKYYNEIEALESLADQMAEALRGGDIFIRTVAQENNVAEWSSLALRHAKMVTEALAAYRAWKENKK